MGWVQRDLPAEGASSWDPGFRVEDTVEHLARSEATFFVYVEPLVVSYKVHCHLFLLGVEGLGATDGAG